MHCSTFSSFASEVINLEPSSVNDVCTEHVNPLFDSQFDSEFLVADNITKDHFVSLVDRDIPFSSVEAPYWETCSRVQEGWPEPLLSWPSVSDLCVNSVAVHDLIFESKRPNFRGLRIPVDSGLNVPLWRSLLNNLNYDDRVICDFLEFGWPLDFQGLCDFSDRCGNHKGASEFPAALDNYLYNEVIIHGSTVGPFSASPFRSCPVVISPLNSVPKRDGQRRIIVDLSWPANGSVNDGLSSEVYLGSPVRVTYPTVDEVAQLILAKGKGCYLYKRDLKRAYRQVPVDPGDYHLLGYRWRGLIFFDRMLPMGLRMAAMACQRTTNAVSSICAHAGFDVLNYLDDFIGVESNLVRAEESFSHLEQLLADLGLVESQDKAEPPATQQVILGVLFDTNALTMSITKERLLEIEELLSDWLSRKTATKSKLQSLLGKLVFVSKCVRQSRLFISRLLAQLRSLRSPHHHFKLSGEFKKDLKWWLRFVRVYNGVSFIYTPILSAPDAVVSTDACLTGCGGISGSEYFHAEFPPAILDLGWDINCLELLTIMVACKLWGHRWRGMHLLVKCDNLASVAVLNSFRTSSRVLADCLREIWYHCAIHDFQIRAIHCPGVENRLADFLSRWHLHSAPELEFRSRFPGVWTELHVRSCHFQFESIV